MSGVISSSSEILPSIKKDFKDVVTIADFSKLLTRVDNEIILKNTSGEKGEILPKHLFYLSKYSDKKYKTFKMRKRNGGTRIIETPDPFLKRIQSTINVLFQILFYDKVNYHNNGFTIGRNIKRNAYPHIQKRYVLNMDIQNYFPSIEFRRVKKVLEYEPFMLVGEKEIIGFYIANICCLSGHLPQGAPTSPILSNIVTQNLDRKISRLAKERRIKYSRYADDLSFSANHNSFNQSLIDEIVEIIKEEGFRVNTSKTRIKSNRDHQEVTGVVVNEKLNVKRAFVKNVRTMINNWEKGGFDYAVGEFNKKDISKGGDKFLSVLSGRLGHIGLIKGKEDLMYRKLNLRLNMLMYKVDYDSITNISVKKKLISDNEKMEKIVLDDIHNSEDKFISFCTSAFHQIENLINYFYWKRFPKMEDLLQYLLIENPGFRNRFKNLENSLRFKKISQLDINVLVYLFEKEFYFSKGIQYKKELTMLRDIRNDDSHRCEVVSFDQNAILEQYEVLKEKWVKFRNKHQRFPIKTKEEEEVEYRYNLIKFMKDQNFNFVRKTLRRTANQIQEYNY